MLCLGLMSGTSADGVDAVLTPTTATVAPKVADIDQSSTPAIASGPYRTPAEPFTTSIDIGPTRCSIRSSEREPDVRREVSRRPWRIAT